MSKYVQAVKNDFRTDYTWNRVFSLGRRGLRAAPEQASLYVTDKFPIIGWLPKYNPRWIISDIIAGLTLGIMLIPQSLAYAKLAKIPVQYGLMSSFLPATIYAFMGTSKDLSTGPTSIIGLLTSEIVNDLKDEYNPSQIASAVALMMGIYCMALGFLKLGFLLEFISSSVLSGFISGIAVTIILGQIDSLLGEDGVGDGTAKTIHDVFHQLPTCDGNAVAIGFCSIILLKGLEYLGKYYGKKNKIIFYFCTSKQFIALLLFTGVSYAVNKKYSNPDDYIFEVSQVKADGIERPRIPDSTLIGKVAARSIAVFVAAAIEHTSIARAFGLRNNYVTDQSQELCYLGITNFFNSFFHSMGVGGAMSRTAVNSSCHVRSPLSGFITTAVVLISIYELTGALYWVPKATLAAIVITAVWPLISSPKVFYRYWKTSLFDFIASMIGFWVSLFVSTEIGIACAVGFSIAYCMICLAFARLTSIGGDDIPELPKSLDEGRDMPARLPSDARVFNFNDSFFFPNAQRVKTMMLDHLQTHHAPHYSSAHGVERERNWSVVGEKRVARLRKKAGVTPDNLPTIRLVILDFTKVNFFDVTAMVKLRDFMAELKKYAGEACEVRLVACNDIVRNRLQRGHWEFVDADSEEVQKEGVSSSATKVYKSVGAACVRNGSEGGSMDEVLEVGIKGDEKV